MLKIKMKFNKILIDYADNRKFSNIAFLVDNDNFIEDIIISRMQLGLNNLIEPEQVLNWCNTQYQDWKIGPYKLQDNNGEKKLEVCNKSESVLESIIINLIIKYNKNIKFFGIILFTILSGKVTDNNIFLHNLEKKSFLMRYIFSQKGYRELEKVEHHMEIKNGKKVFRSLHIDVYPETTHEDIMFHFNKIKENFIYRDTIKNIRRDREWYWMHKEGMSYKQITDKAFMNGINISRDGVIKAIQQYQKNLNTDI
jgi:hypothetical protein